MSKKTATIILNRNLPKVTEDLYCQIEKNDGMATDIYVLEAGSDEDKLSKYCSWWANTEDIMANGLRFPRGINYALVQLLKEDRFSQYEYFMMLTNDAVLQDSPVIAILEGEMEEHTRVGILSPCSKRWGEARLLVERPTKYFWYIHNVAFMMRRGYIESIANMEEPNYMDFLYDGTNFRGWASEVELVAKGYANDWATAITSKVWVDENEEHLKTKAELIKTDSYEINLKEYIEEGRRWLRKKYGFNSRWTIQMYSKHFYDKFFEFFPELVQYRI